MLMAKIKKLISQFVARFANGYMANHNGNPDTCTALLSVDTYLKEVKVQNEQKNQGLQMVPTGTHIRDDEQVR